MNDVLPCPFCGSDNCFVASHDEGGLYAFICSNCDGKGGWESSHEEALTAWNRRLAASLPVGAKRYEWLRECLEIKYEDGVWWTPEMARGFPSETRPPNLDAAIDAAIAASPSGVGGDT